MFIPDNILKTIYAKQLFVFLELLCLSEVDTLLLFYRWKHIHLPSCGMFSTSHNGDVIENLQLLIEDKITWSTFYLDKNKRISLELEQNFVNFANWFKNEIQK